jgi:hemolysin III
VPSAVDREPFGSTRRTWANHGVVTMMLDLREPFSALSHGLGLVLAFPVTLLLWRRSGRAPARLGPGPTAVPRTSFERGKRLALLVFGASLVACYGGSAAFHGAQVQGEELDRLRRLDYIGIYLLIAGTYTPAAWAMMGGSMRRGTLTAVWATALGCSARVWLGGAMPAWISTAIYLSMGWGVLLCYRELARRHGHRKLAALPLGGVLYSVGAAINLLGRPAPVPGVFGAHELFHCFVLAGTASHVWFMLRAVIPAVPPEALDSDSAGPGAAPLPEARPGPAAKTGILARKAA